MQFTKRLAFCALAGIGATLPWCWLDVAIAWQPSVQTFGLASALAVAAGLLLSVVTHLVHKDRWFAALVLWPLPLLTLSDFLWAADRAMHLVPSLSWVLGWLQSFLAASTAFVAAFVIVRSRMPNRVFWRWFAAGASALVIGVLLIGPLRSHARQSGPWTMVALWLALLWALAWVRSLHLLHPLLAVAAGACLALIPDEYPGLQACFGGLAVGATLTLTRRGLRRWLSQPTTGPRSPALVFVLGALAALGVASAIAAKSEGLTYGKRGRGGVASLLLRAGRLATDFDRDGHGVLFGQRDCRPLDATVHPGQLEQPQNGVDDNCMLGDAQGDPARFFRSREALNAPPSAFSGDLVVALVDSLLHDATESTKLPAIETLMRQGVHFEHAYASSSVTPLSLLGILSGRLPTNIELSWRNPFNGYPVRPPGGLAPRLARAGFETAMVGVPDASYTDSFQPNTFGQGFERIEHVSDLAPAEEVTDRAIAAYRAMDASKRRFLFVYYIQVHNAIRSREQYLAEAASVDRAIGRLRREIGHDALWVLLADHGEEWYEHGRHGHARTLYEEVVRVPLVITGPGIGPRSVKQVSPLRSLMPTLMAMLVSPSGAERGPFLCVDQPSCVDLPAPMALRMQTLHLQGLVLGRRKIIHNLNEGWIVAFDLERDPEEKSPLPSVPDDLEAELMDWEESGFSAVGDSHVWPYGANDP